MKEAETVAPVVPICTTNSVVSAKPVANAAATATPASIPVGAEPDHQALVIGRGPPLYELCVVASVHGFCRSGAGGSGIAVASPGEASSSVLELALLGWGIASVVVVVVIDKYGRRVDYGRLLVWIHVFCKAIESGSGF